MPNPAIDVIQTQSNNLCYQLDRRGHLVTLLGIILQIGRSVEACTKIEDGHEELAQSLREDWKEEFIEC